jgi:hypothetical protein
VVRRQPGSRSKKGALARRHAVRKIHIPNVEDDAIGQIEELGGSGSIDCSALGTKKVPEGDEPVLPELARRKREG